jgi:hypothetical protein
MDDSAYAVVGMDYRTLTADAFRIVAAHERRHMAQARRVMASDGFPPCGF